MTETGESDICAFKASALSAVNFKLVYSEEDLVKHNDDSTFGPDMAHQVFGEGEAIFGYKNLEIDLYYLHNSSKCFLDFKYSKKIEKFDADDVVDLLNPWLPTGYVSKIEDFKKIVQNEKHDQMFGDIIHQFERTTEVTALPGKTVTCQYKITQCDAKDQLFQEYHQRFETYIIWFIDAANFIDLSDDRWLIFYVYEEYRHPDTEELFVTPIGYTAIYKFFSYPNNNRARISQFFILPTHQRKGLGTELYKAVYNKVLRQMEDIVDITVEEPSEPFQRMRDICDSMYVYHDLKETNTNLTAKSPKIVSNYMLKHKFGKRQASRLADILNFFKALKNGNIAESTFTNELKERIKAKVEREFTTQKRARGLAVMNDNNALMEESSKARFDNYVLEIKPVAEYLRNKLE